MVREISLALSVASWATSLQLARKGEEGSGLHRLRLVFRARVRREGNHLSVISVGNQGI